MQINGPVTVNLSLECNTTHFRRTGLVDTEGQLSQSFRYYFGVRCFDANNSEVSRLWYMIMVVQYIDTDCISD